MMKKSTFGAILAFLFADKVDLIMANATGALTAAALYLRRREKELDEYERLLYSDDTDYDLEDEEDEPSYEPIQTQPEGEGDPAGEDEVKF